MAAPILWAPGIFWFFLLETPHAHKIPPFGGGGVLGFFRRGGGSANFIFMGVGIFPKVGMRLSAELELEAWMGMLECSHVMLGDAREATAVRESLGLQKPWPSAE